METFFSCIPELLSFLHSRIFCCWFPSSCIWLACRFPSPLYWSPLGMWRQATTYCPFCFGQWCRGHPWPTWWYSHGCCGTFWGCRTLQNYCKFLYNCPIDVIGKLVMSLLIVRSKNCGADKNSVTDCVSSNASLICCQFAGWGSYWGLVLPGVAVSGWY